jgi:Fe-S-cluster containining protein
LRFLAELKDLYEEINRLPAGSASPCLGGGGCCKFDLAGHRLYLTAGEMAFLVEAPPAPISCSRGACETIPGAAPSSGDGTGRAKMRCPYQRRGRCSAYDRRPLGCRAYLCRPADPDWCSRVYEQYHKRVAQLHERFALPYFYVELTAGLEQVLDEKKPEKILCQRRDEPI